MEKGRQQNKRHARVLILGLATGPVIYSVYFFAVYAFVEVICRTRFAGDELLGFGIVPLVVVGLTLLAALVIAVGGFVSFRAWQRSDAKPEYQHDAYSRFAAAAGMGLNAYFLVVTIATAAPVLLKVTCTSI